MKFSAVVALFLVTWFLFEGKKIIAVGLLWGYGLSIVNYYVMSKHFDKYLGEKPKLVTFFINNYCRYILLLIVFSLAIWLNGFNFGIASLGGFSLIKWVSLIKYLEDAINLDYPSNSSGRR